MSDDTLTWTSPEVVAARNRGDRQQLRQWAKDGRLKLSEHNPYAPRSEPSGDDSDNSPAPRREDALSWTDAEVRQARERGDHSQIKRWMTEGRLTPSPTNPIRVNVPQPPEGADDGD